MHACPPARNDILSGPTHHDQHVLPTNISPNRHYSQVRVDPRHARLLDRPRQRPEPPLGPPLERVLAPDGRVRVARGDVREDRRALRDRDLPYQRPVDAADGLGEREGRVSLRAAAPNRRKAKSVGSAQSSLGVQLTL